MGRGNLMSGELHEEMPWLHAASREETSRVVEALYRLHRLTTALTDLDTLLNRISNEAKTVAGAEAASVILYDAVRNELYFHTALGDSGDQDALKREVRLTLEQGIAGATARERRSFNVTDAQSDPRFFRDAGLDRDIPVSLVGEVRYLAQRKAIVEALRTTAGRVSVDLGAGQSVPVSRRFTPEVRAALVQRHRLHPTTVAWPLHAPFVCFLFWRI